jgi:positive regulator of sigma E activity
MKTREIEGTVVEVEGDRAVVQLEEHESCGGTFSCACCAGASQEPRKLHVTAEGLSVGDTVQVSIPAYAGYIGTLVVFLLPVGLFVAGMLIGGAVEGGEGANGMGPIIGGICGFALAVLIAMGVNRLLNRATVYEVR